MIHEDDEVVRRFLRRFGYSDPPYFVLGLVLLGMLLMFIEIIKTVEY